MNKNSEMLNSDNNRCGIVSNKHEDMNDLMHGWEKRIEEMEEYNAELKSKNKQKSQKGKLASLPSEKDPDFTYGMITHDLNARMDPFRRSNAIIEQRIAKQEAEQRKLLKKNQKAKKKIDPMKPTAASIGHTKLKPPEPQLKDTFKMKRFTQFEHGKIDTGLRKNVET